MEDKKSYETPQLIVYGNVEAITKGNATGDRLDQTFEAGTAASELTFS